MPHKELHKFSISYLQILDEEGNVDKELEPKLSQEQLTSLYRWMWFSREADQRKLKLQRQGRCGTFGPCTGHEAVNCGIGLAMAPNDWYSGAFREFGVHLMRGVPYHQTILFHNGYEEGNRNPEIKNHLPYNIIVGSQLLHAAGIGYALKYKEEKDSAVVTVCGDGATSQGDFHEGLNFASVWKAPVVFVIQNNQWAISIPRKQQANSRTLAQRAIAYDIPGIQVDGNDALAVYHTVQKALQRAKNGEGPSLIEAITYRLIMHTTADDPTKYRTKEEEEYWWQREPLKRFRIYLEKKGFWNDQQQKSMEQEIMEEIDREVTKFESIVDFKPDAPFDHVYGTKHDEIERQRTEFLENLKKESGHA